MDYIVYVRPEDDRARLFHDSGRIFEGVREVIHDREAFRISLEAIPNGWGARLVVEERSTPTVELRGILWLDRGPLAELVVDDVTLRPFESRPLPRLVVSGQFLAREDGTRFTAIECSDFNLLARFSAGEDIRPILKQRSDLGFNLLRVFTLMHLSQWGIGDLDPCPYDKIKAFCKLCAKFGLYVEFTAYTSTWRADHWSRLGQALAGVTNAICELVNENDQVANHIETDGFQPLPGLLCSHGSNGSQAAPVSPIWHYATFHTNDAFEWQRKVGHNAMEIWNGPTLSNENTRFPDKDSSLEHSYDAAAGAALLCAGSCFHSVSGKRSTVWEGAELELARAWAAGARSVPLEFQLGRYVRLEPGNFLRVYQRVLADNRAWTVRIRN